MWMKDKRIKNHKRKCFFWTEHAMSKERIEYVPNHTVLSISLATSAGPPPSPPLYSYAYKICGLEACMKTNIFQQIRVQLENADPVSDT